MSKGYVGKYQVDVWETRLGKDIFLHISHVRVEVRQPHNCPLLQSALGSLEQARDNLRKARRARSQVYPMIISGHHAKGESDSFFAYSKRDLPSTSILDSSHGFSSVARSHLLSHHPGRRLAAGFLELHQSRRNHVACGLGDLAIASQPSRQEHVPEMWRPTAALVFVGEGENVAIISLTNIQDLKS